MTTTVTETHTIEGVDLEGDVPCSSARPYVRCDRPADLIVATCSDTRWPICRPCWTEAARDDGFCSVNRTYEDRDEHYRLVEVLR